MKAYDYSKSCLGAALAIGLSLGTAQVAQAGVLTDVSVTLSDPVKSRPSNLTLSYRIQSAVAPGQKLAYIRVAGMTFSNGPCDTNVTVKVNDVVLSPSAIFSCDLFSNDTIEIIKKSPETILAGAMISITIDSSRVVTANTAGTYSFTAFKTTYGNGTVIDEPAAYPSVTILEAAPVVAVPTLTEWAMIGLGGLLAMAGAVGITRRRSPARPA